MNAPSWPGAAALRVGLGCMRLSTDADRDEERAFATIAAAAEAGVTVFDTARSYGRGAEELGHNERLLVEALRACGAANRAHIVTKGGMARSRGAWVPDGRAKALRADCEASLEALDGLGIGLYLVHAPDPRTPWRTTVRALARLVDDGLVPRVGLSNVNRTQLDEALELAPIGAVEVPLSPFDDRALRGGVVARCEERGISVIAHTPLGGPRRAPGLERHDALSEVAVRHGATAPEIALAWLLGLSSATIVIPGARRPETARSAARAATIALGDDDRAVLGPRRTTRAGRVAATDTEVVLVMGIPGAGKTRLAQDYASRGYKRLNRDERGGTLRQLAETLDETLASGAPRVVLDNTYLTRVQRSHVIETATRHRALVRCVWLATPLAQAQVNLVERLLERFGGLPAPQQLADVSDEPGLMAPTSQMRALRQLEAPAVDEGFATVERMPFERVARGGQAGVLVAASAVEAPNWQKALGTTDPTAPHLVFDWRPNGSAADLAGATGALSRVVSGPVEGAVCPHGGGPPICWCRPPLPGLPLAFTHAHRLDPTRCVLIGTTTTHRTLATALGAIYIEA